MGKHRFPTVVGVRYQGAPIGTDADRLDIDRDIEGGIPTRAEFALTIADVIERAGSASSPSHAIDVSTDTAGVVVRFRQNERLNRDVAVRWAACESQVGVSLITGGGLPGDDGHYGLLTIVPPAAPVSTFARDLTLLIDASGSMTGDPLECAKEIARTLIRSLEARDRFEILSFANQPRRLTAGLEHVSERSVEHALAALAQLQAGGGTEMGKGIEEALRPLRNEAQRQVILLSDGEIGFEHEVVGRVASALPAGCRLHAVGIGSAGNRTRTHALARAGRGTEVVVDGQAKAGEAAQRLLAATARPVLTDLVVRGSALRALAPARPADVLAGQPLRLTAELDANGGTLEIEGLQAGSSEPWRHRVDVPAADADGSRSTPLPIGALHGREAITDLEQELASGRAEVLERIESRGLRHRITSRRTSLVAIAEEPAVDPKQPRRREKLPVELPAGVSAEGVGLMGPAFSPRLWNAGDRRNAHLVVRKKRSLMDSSALEQGSEYATSMVRGPLDLPLPRATIIRRHGDLLIVEFAIPFDGFELPSEVEVLWNGNVLGAAKVDGADSSPPGPHKRRVLVRMALRFDWDTMWRADQELTLRWTSPQLELMGSRFRLAMPVATRAENPA